MSEDNHTPDGSSGANDTDDNPGGDEAGGQEKKPKTVTREAFDRLLGEKKALAKKLRALEEDQQSRSTKEAEEKQQFRELYEAAKAKLAEKDEEINGLRGVFTEAAKKQHFLEALDGGLDRKWHHLIDTKKIVIDEETGEIDQHSVKVAVDEFKGRYGEVIKKRSNGRLPPDAPGGKPQALSYEDWLKLPLAEKKKRMGEVMTK